MRWGGNKFMVFNVLVIKTLNTHTHVQGTWRESMDAKIGIHKSLLPCQTYLHRASSVGGDVVVISNSKKGSTYSKRNALFAQEGK